MLRRAGLYSGQLRELWEQTWRREAFLSAVSERNVDWNTDWTKCVGVSRDDTTRLSCQDPKMSEGLQMTLIIQDSGWKDGIEGAEKRSYGQVAPAECVRATSKEER